MRTALARTLTGAATAAFLASGVLTAPPAHAAGGGTISTIAGGPGGPFAARDMAQNVVAVALTPSRVWVVDWLQAADTLALRTIDRTTGVESAPLLALPTPDRVYFDMPSLAVEPNGNVLLAYNGPQGGVVLDVTPDGWSRRVAGGGAVLKPGAEGLPATAVRLGTINGLALGANGVVYGSENLYANGTTVPVTQSRIFKIGSEGRLTTYAGLGSWAPHGTGFQGDDGPALAASFNGPTGLAVDGQANLWVADTGNSRVRLILPGTAGLAGDVVTEYAPTSATSLSASPAGVYVPGAYGCGIERLGYQYVTHVAGDGTCGWSGDGGPARSGALQARAVASSGYEIAFIQGAYSSVTYDYQVRLVDTSGTLRSLTMVDKDTPPTGGDGGPALRAQLSGTTQRAAVDASGNVYVVHHGDRVRRIAPDGTISTVVGTGRHAWGAPDTGVGGPATAASLRSVGDVVVAPDGSLYVSGRNRYVSGEDRLYRVGSDGTLQPVLGDGGGGSSPDGTPATQAHVSVSSFALDAAGGVVFNEGCRIRRVDTAGLVTTVAGSPSSQSICGHTADGAPAASALLGAVGDLEIDPLGRVAFLERETASASSTLRLRRVELDGTLGTLAGDGTSTADGVPATSAALDGYVALAQDPTGRLLVVSTLAGLIRRIELDGTISTIAGGGSGPDGGPAKGATLLRPSDVAVGPSGDLYIACTDTRTPYGGGAIRKVTNP